MEAADSADSPAVPVPVPPLMDAPRDDDGEEWLGCEALHPLTWLPPSIALSPPAGGHAAS